MQNTYISDMSFELPTLQPIVNINSEVNLSNNCVNEICGITNMFLKENQQLITTPDGASESVRGILLQNSFLTMVEQVQEIIIKDQEKTLLAKKKIEELELALRIFQRNNIQILMNYSKQIIANAIKGINLFADSYIIIGRHNNSSRISTSGSKVETYSSNFRNATDITDKSNNKTVNSEKNASYCADTCTQSYASQLPTEVVSRLEKDAIADQPNTINSMQSFADVSNCGQTFPPQTSTTDEVNPLKDTIRESCNINTESSNVEIPVNAADKPFIKDDTDLGANKKSYSTNTALSINETADKFTKIKSMQSFKNISDFMKAVLPQTSNTDGIDLSIIELSKAEQVAKATAKHKLKSNSESSKNVSNCTQTFPPETLIADAADPKIATISKLYPISAVSSKTEEANNETDKLKTINSTNSLIPDIAEAALPQIFNTAGTNLKRDNIKESYAINIDSPKTENNTQPVNSSPDCTQNYSSQVFFKDDCNPKTDATNTVYPTNISTSKAVNLIDKPHRKNVTQNFEGTQSCTEILLSQTVSTNKVNATVELKTITNIQSETSTTDCTNPERDKEFYSIITDSLKAEKTINAINKSKTLNDTQSLKDVRDCIQNLLDQVFIAIGVSPQTNAHYPIEIVSSDDGKADKTTDKFKKIKNTMSYCTQHLPSETSIVDDVNSKTSATKKPNTSISVSSKAKKTDKPKTVYSTQNFKNVPNFTEALVPQTFKVDGAYPKKDNIYLSKAGKAVSSANKKKLRTQNIEAVLDCSETLSSCGTDPKVPYPTNNASSKSIQKATTATTYEPENKKRKTTLTTTNEDSETNSAKKKIVSRNKTRLKYVNNNLNTIENEHNHLISSSNNSMERYLLARIEAITYRFLKPETILANNFIATSSELILPVKDIMASKSLVAKFMQYIDVMFQTLRTVLTNFIASNIPSLQFSEDIPIVKTATGEGKIHCLLIPLKEGLRSIFPGILACQYVRYIRYSHPNTLQIIMYINYAMQKSITNPHYDLEYLSNLYHRTFVKVIANNIIITYEILKTIYNEIVSLLLPLIIGNILYEFKEFPVSKKCRAEDFLTRNELRLIDPEVIKFLNHYQPILIADFIENFYIKGMLATNKMITENDMFDYFINRDLIKFVFRMQSKNL